VYLALALRAVCGLIAAAPARIAPFHKLRGALSPDTWRRRGIYLIRSGQDAEPYAVRFRRFLEGGFLIPPEPGLPLILPDALSPGGEAALAGLLKDR
jgi:hypothetical protein